MVQYLEDHNLFNASKLDFRNTKSTTNALLWFLDEVSGDFCNGVKYF